MGQKDRHDVIHSGPMNSEAHRELSKLNGIEERGSAATKTASGAVGMGVFHFIMLDRNTATNLCHSRDLANIFIFFTFKNKVKKKKF